ncbi:hypothetical protein XELAEV_18004161mg [Xenopus laevis]|uniref:Secreted protein n=1 Tax=Xenopus laevis TaxID=8355 RepID=A0A974BNR2_XENLA|nr:hypothetical protein XELAEV_18003117mg [Xenopus laevis]OCT56980.1 hypothetical protein XELAEV_18004161mg [Xenopus laevis]
MNPNRLFVLFGFLFGFHWTVYCLHVTELANHQRDDHIDPRPLHFSFFHFAEKNGAHSIMCCHVVNVVGEWDL